MGGKTSSTPAPDYTSAATATAAGNLQNLQYQTAANRPDITTPWGTDTWSAPAADGSQSESINLTPAEQSALTSQQQVTQNQSNLALGMQGNVASTMANGFQAPQMSSYMGGVGSTNQNFSGFSPSGSAVNDQYFDPSSYTSGNQGVNQNFSTTANQQNQNLQTGANVVNQSLTSAGQNVNTNAAGAVAPAGNTNTAAPTFSSADAQNGAQAAYQAQVGLMQPQMTQDTTNLDAQLRLQGLTPGSEAYNNAAQNLSNTQNLALTTAANNAVQTGNNEANQNYASSLAGYNAGNAAQEQAYGQDANTYSLGNAALGQQYSQDSGTFNADNAAQNQTYTQGANTANFNNTAANTQYANDLSGYNAQNTARTQAQTNSLAGYNAALTGQSAYNTAQNQGYTQALGTYGANQTAQENSNAAQNQAYTQGMGSYQTAYNSALSNYNEPLNAMNAVTNGNQVTMPNFGTYATAGTTPGTDYTTAAQNTGQYNSAQTAANAASSSSLLGSLGSIGASYFGGGGTLSGLTAF